MCICQAGALFRRWDRDAESSLCGAIRCSTLRSSSYEASAISQVAPYHRLYEYSRDLKNGDPAL